MKRIFILALLSFCFVNLGFTQSVGVIDPELYELMNSRSGEKISVNIILKDKIDANELNVRKSFSSKDAQRAYMINEMKYQAEKSQADILETLQAGERGNQVTDVNCHWLTNMINCNANADAINKIAKHPDVEAIIYNKLEKLIPDTKAEPASPIRGNTQNITQIKADKVWELGFTGEGVIVAVIDTGVNTAHVDLEDHLWTSYVDTNNDGTPDQYVNGWNALDKNYDITDRDGHGTHCAGTICGDGSSGTATGMAPDATLMCIKALGDNGEGTAESMVSAVEYAVENGADILSMSLGFSYPGTSVNEIMRELFSNTLTAGVVASVAAGNDGRSSVLAQYPVPRNINAPGSCPPPYLSSDQVERGGTTSVICIGAVDYGDVACDFSSQGPVSWENTSYADYPYGTGIPTKTLHYDDGTYGGSYSGTYYYAVMFPPSMLTGIENGGVLESVSTFEGYPTSGTFYIYEGGTTPKNATQLHSQTYTLNNQSASMVDIALNKTINVDKNKNLWVVFKPSSGEYPLPATATTSNDANGRWFSTNGNNWQDGANSGFKGNWLIRAKVTTSNTAETHYGLIRPDVVAPGYMIESASHTSTNGYATMSGTSMATPCAAGAMALLLDANPSLTPADICQVLEETSVKLTATKDNKTGTGRINIYDAVLSVAADLPLSAPTLTATAQSTSEISLSWTTAPGATSYTVYRDDAQIASVTTTSYSDTGLDPETQYCYTVKAIKGSESATSNESCATTLAENTGGGGSGECEIIFTLTDSYGDGWNDAYIHIYDGNNIDEVIDFQNPGDREIKTKTHTLSIPQGTVITAKLYTGNFPREMSFTIAYEGGENIYTMGTDNNLYNKETHTILPSYTVDCGASTPEPEPTVPSAPTNLTATAQSTSAIGLTWDAVDGAASYNVYRGGAKITNVATGTTYSDTGLSADTQYCYTVTAVNNVGESAYSNEACARTQAETPTVPSAPTLAATAQSTTAIGLTWTSVSGATSYNVYRGGTKITNVATGTTYSDTGLTPNTQYCYKVTAVNNVGESAKSNEACATTQTENTGGGGGGEGVVEIGFPTTSDTPNLPFDTYYSYSFSQQIYTAEEINEVSNMSGSMITKIAFKQSNNLVVNREIAVYIENTTETGFADNNDWIDVTDATKVFDEEVTLPGTDKYLEIRLDTPVEYTGGNLLISVFDKSDSFSNYGRFYCYTTTDRERSLIHSNYGSHTNINPADMTYSGNRIGQNNAINITFEAATAIIPFPQNVKATPANIFVDQSTTISWDACAGASSYNIYVDGVNRGSSNSTSYVLSNLQYNMNPGAKVTVTAIVDGEESEPSKDVVVKVGGYFPLVINVVDHLGNPMQDVTIDLDGYDEIGNAISQTYTSDANGSVSVAKMPLPLLNNCYNLEAVKSIYTGYATICDYDNAYGDIIKDVEHVVTIVMELPSPMALYADKDTYAVGENIILTWDKVTSASPQGYNLYEKYWDDGSLSFIYEKINANLIPANTNTYTVVGGLPTRGCDNTICLTAVYTESETSKGKPSVTVAKTGTGTMAGIVVDENGNPISGVSVTVQGTSCDGSGSYEYTYTTGANGKFGENMPMGIYNVFANKPGSIYNDRSVFDIEIVHGEETEVIIEMWEKGDEYEIEREIGENPAPYIDYSGPVLPVSTGFLYSASQQIYLKEELNFASASDVKITSVSFRVYGNTNAGKQDTIRIFVQNTTKAEFATLKDWIQVYDDDSGFTGSYTVPSDGEWVTFNFAKPLEYTGGNLLVAAHRHAPALQHSGFYVCETETRRSLCGADNYFNPVNMQTDATALYKINNIKITYTTTSPEVVITPDPIEFGEVIVGDYWREKPDVTVPVQIESYNSEVENITIDEPFFTLPALSLPEDDLLEFEMGYDRNGTPGSKYGIMTVTPNKGVVKGVKVTATAYDPVEPDVFEKSREVVWVDDEYEDTPDFATLHDDYILPGENPEGTRFDAVYRFTLDEDATLTAEVLNGSNPLVAFYKENFANDNVDKEGPSSDNYYYYGTTSVVEGLSFPAGTYYAVPAAETNFTFRLTRSIDQIIFIGTGDWKVPSNWNINSVPVATDDVIIRGDAHVNDGVYINSIFIESVGTLTVEPTGTLDVIGGIENNLHSAFVIEDGGQVYQNAADVAATFNMNINNPASWGPDGSNHANGWQFIASPFLDADMLNYVRPDEGDYDLYKYDGTQHLEWVNYKLHHDEFIHDFADGMQGWTSLDANGDGYTWSYNGGAGKDGAAGYLSCVFNGGASNDYLVSPKIINTYPESKLRFWVKNASNVTTTSEVEVWLSADKAASPTAAGDFVTKVGTVTVTNEWQQVEFLLEAYADQDDRDFMEYWMAIRCTSGASANAGVMVDHLELANYEEANPYETEFVLGRGYMASYESDGEATIQGVLNHERTFDYKVAFNADDRWENFYLIGNPFPFNIKWTDFTHSNIVNGFAVVDNDGSYVYDVNADIKVGDGIMIMTTGANPSVSVTKGNRNAVSDHINVVARGTEGDDNFIISLSGEEYAGYKKLENFNGEISTVYVSEYGTQYGIVNRDADVEEVEFCFDAKKMGYYTIDVILDGNYSSVTLYDRVENVETDMLSGNGYKFFALDAIENYNRFVLRFSKKTDSDGGNFVYQSGDELVIDAEGLVQIIDVMGRIVYSGDQSGINRVNVNGLENSACVVRNINNNEVRTQKIVIL